MADEVSATSTSVSAIAVTGAVGAVVLLLVLVCSVGKTQNKLDDKTSDDSKDKKNKSKNKLKSKIPCKVKKPAVPSFTHKLLVGTLKGHMDSIYGLDLSPNGKYLATVSEDRSVMIWSVKEFTLSDHKSHRAKTELDHGMNVKFSPDSKAFLINTYNTNQIEVYKMEKKADNTIAGFTLARSFPLDVTHDVVSVDIASSGKFIMVSFNDTTIKLWDIQGKLLHTIDTKQINNYHGAVSPCGRYLGSSGFTSDVKIWEVVFAPKTGVFTDVVRAFDLTGHKAAVYSFAFNNDSSRMATLSKDNTWKFWDTNVQYKQGQDPILLYTMNVTVTSPCSIVLSPDGHAAAISTNSGVMLYSTYDGKMDDTMEDIYSGDVMEMSFTHSNKYLVTCGDRQAHVFHNISGYKSTISHLEKEVQSAKKELVKQRLQTQLSEAKLQLDSVWKSIEEKSSKK